MPISTRIRHRGARLAHLRLGIAVTFGLLCAAIPFASAQTVVPRITLDDPGIGDQDDMCVWIHPTNRSLSTIITSDKGANTLFVYDLAGNTVQAIGTPGQPGNIDLRYGFVLAGNPVDIVVLNDRDHNTLLVYGVNPATRMLARIDNGAIGTFSNYGSCLFHDLASGGYYAFTTSGSGAIGQYRLVDQSGQVGGTLVRSWDIGGQTEACACDDQTGIGYFDEEDVGVWKVGAAPGDPTTGMLLIAAVGDPSGLTADVEGIAIYHAGGGQGYLLVSSQGSSTYKVYDRKPPHAFIKSFTVAGVTGTDGLDVANVALGPSFPFGIFTVHNDTPPTKSIEVCAYQDLGLSIDVSSWNPRNPRAGVPDPGPSSGVRLSVYPNPFRPSTHIQYQLSRRGRVRLQIEDISGRVVVDLVDRVEEGGAHAIVWDGRDSRGKQMGAGVYLVSIQAEGRRRSSRVVRTR